eukprot:scaffold25189_cov60-Phaeocystis_antarctica.AAC.2
MRTLRTHGCGGGLSVRGRPGQQGVVRLPPLARVGLAVLLRVVEQPGEGELGLLLAVPVAWGCERWVLWR